MHARRRAELRVSTVFPVTEDSSRVQAGVDRCISLEAGRLSPAGRCSLHARRDIAIMPTHRNTAAISEREGAYRLRPQALDFFDRLNKDSLAQRMTWDEPMAKLKQASPTTSTHHAPCSATCNILHGARSIDAPPTCLPHRRTHTLPVATAACEPPTAWRRLCSAASYRQTVYDGPCVRRSETLRVRRSETLRKRRARTA